MRSASTVGIVLHAEHRTPSVDWFENVCFEILRPGVELRPGSEWESLPFQEAGRGAIRESYSMQKSFFLALEERICRGVIPVVFFRHRDGHTRTCWLRCLKEGLGWSSLSRACQPWSRFLHLQWTSSMRTLMHGLAPMPDQESWRRHVDRMIQQIPEVIGDDGAEETFHANAVRGFRDALAGRWLAVRQGAVLWHCQERSDMLQSTREIVKGYISMHSDNLEFAPDADVLEHIPGCDDRQLVQDDKSVHAMSVSEATTTASSGRSNLMKHKMLYLPVGNDVWTCYQAFELQFLMFHKEVK